MDTTTCREPYCLNHNPDTDGCEYAEHGVWCDNRSTHDVYGQCTINARDGDPGQGSGWHHFDATCALDAATYITGELDVHTVAQLDAALVSLAGLRALMMQDETFRQQRHTAG